MTARSIQWIADSGLLVGLTTMGEFGPPSLGVLSLSSTTFAMSIPASGAILGATAGSVITAAALPAGLTINAAPGWAYDGSGTTGTHMLILTETLVGCPNSPNATTIAVTISASPSPAGAALDFSQPANSGLIAALRSF